MPRVLLEIDGADTALLHELRGAVRDAGISLTPQVTPGRLERKSWPPTPEDVQFVLDWAGNAMTVADIAKVLVGVLAGRGLRIRLNRRPVAVREPDVLEVLREAQAEDRPAESGEE